MEQFHCATCGNVLSVPVRQIAEPVGPPVTLLSHHHVNPPLMEAGTYAVDPGPHGRERVTGTFVMSPGDVRGTRFIHELVLVGCWSLVAWEPCLACEVCGTLVATRADDCYVPQETRFLPAVVRRESCVDPGSAPDPFAHLADWDEGAPDTRQFGWQAASVRERPELVATRWRVRGLQERLFRDDPPA